MQKFLTYLAFVMLTLSLSLGCSKRTMTVADAVQQAGFSGTHALITSDSSAFPSFFLDTTKQEIVFGWERSLNSCFMNRITQSKFVVRVDNTKIKPSVEFTIPADLRNLVIDPALADLWFHDPQSFISSPYCEQVEVWMTDLQIRQELRLPPK